MMAIHLFLERRRSFLTKPALMHCSLFHTRSATPVSNHCCLSTSIMISRSIHQITRIHPPRAVIQQWRSIFVQTAETPNPESLKFVPTGVPVIQDANQTGQGFYVTQNDEKTEILRSPLAQKILKVDGVKAVFLGSDFVTVTKRVEEKWKNLRPELFQIIMDWAESGEAALLDTPVVTDTTILDDDDEIVAMIKELIESRIRPAVQEDGGDIRYVSFEEETGIVTVQLAGSCVGCPSSSVTLKQGVENMLTHYIPEVKAVVATEEEGDDDAVDNSVEPKQNKSYEERLAAAGIPFSE